MVGRSTSATLYRYRFGDVVIDAGQRRAWVGKRPLALGKLPFN
jgi:hypothetical protein